MLVCQSLRSAVLYRPFPFLIFAFNILFLLYVLPDRDHSQQDLEGARPEEEGERASREAPGWSREARYEGQQEPMNDRNSISMTSCVTSVTDFVSMKRTKVVPTCT